MVQLFFHLKMVEQKNKLPPENRLAVGRDKEEKKNEELTDKQKKLPPALQKAIAKNRNIL